MRATRLHDINLFVHWVDLWIAIGIGFSRLCGRVFGFGRESEEYERVIGSSARPESEEESRMAQEGGKRRNPRDLLVQ